MFGKRELGLEENVVQGLRYVFVPERMHAGEKLVEDDARREQIRPLVVISGPNLLRRHVYGCAQADSRPCQIGGRNARNAKVQDLYRADRRHMDVSRLDVPVNDLMRVRMIQTVRDLDHDGKLLLQCHRDLFLYDPLQFLPLEKFHHDVGYLPLLTQVVNGHDVGMVQARGRASLAIKAELQFRVPLDVLCHRFYGDVTVQNLVVGLVHRPHGPFAEPLDNGVFPESVYHRVFFFIRDSDRRQSLLEIFKLRP